MRGKHPSDIGGDGGSMLLAFDACHAAAHALRRGRSRPQAARHARSRRTAAPAAVTVLNNHEVEGILGREVRSTADENMGRIVDVLVDRSGQVRAAIIDFGGFLGVGSRKIAVDWNALHFPAPAKTRRARSRWN